MSKIIKIFILILPISLALLSMQDSFKPYYTELKYLFYFVCVLIYSWLKYSTESEKPVTLTNNEPVDSVSNLNLILCDQIPKYEIKKHYELDHFYFIQSPDGQFYYLLINYIADNNELEQINKIFNNNRWFRLFPNIKYYFSSKTNSLHTEDNLLENCIGINSIAYSFVILKLSKEESNYLRTKRHYRLSIDNFNILRSDLINNEHELSRFLSVNFKNNQKFTLGSNVYKIKTFEYYYFVLIKSSDHIH